MTARPTLSCLAGFAAALLSAQTFRERVDVELVRVDLIATDGRGRFVSDLRPSDIRVRSGRVRLKPGAYRWSFAIRDEQTGITSYLTFDRKLP